MLSAGGGHLPINAVNVPYVYTVFMWAWTALLSLWVLNWVSHYRVRPKPGTTGGTRARGPDGRRREPWDVRPPPPPPPPPPPLRS